MDKQNNEIDQKKINELLKDRAKSGILAFRILLVVVLLLDIIYISGKFTPGIISFSIFAVLFGLGTVTKLINHLAG